MNLVFELNSRRWVVESDAFLDAVCAARHICGMKTANSVPSGVQVLAKISETLVVPLSQLASQLRLTPSKVRSDVSALVERGWAARDPDPMLVKITGKGREVLAKHPEIVIAAFEPIAPFDSDRAIDDALNAASTKSSLLSNEAAERDTEIENLPRRMVAMGDE